MKRFIILAVILFATAQMTASQIKEASPADVASIDSIMKAVYDVISGDAGKALERCFIRTRD